MEVKDDNGSERQILPAFRQNEASTDVRRPI
jgi:hypothetical protein